MIFSGKKEQFAIEAEITSKEGEWIFGHLRFWLHGTECGNWNDDVDLRGSHSWLKDFIQNQQDRYEPGMFEATPIVVFQLLVEPIFPANPNARVPEVYQKTDSRFHIGHLGMSSFNRVRMVLIENSTFQRCVWEAGLGEGIHDDLFPSGHMQQVAKDFCSLLEREIASLGIAL